MIPLPYSGPHDVLVAFVILRNASPHCTSLESIIGPYRSETCHFSRFMWLVCFNVLFWSLEDLLGIGDEVLYFGLNIAFPRDC